MMQSYTRNRANSIAGLGVFSPRIAPISRR